MNSTSNRQFTRFAVVAVAGPLLGLGLAVASSPAAQAGPIPGPQVLKDKTKPPQPPAPPKDLVNPEPPKPPKPKGPKDLAVPPTKPKPQPAPGVNSQSTGSHSSGSRGSSSSSKSTPSATAQPTGSVIPPPATPTPLPTQLDEVAAGIGSAEQADGDSGLALGALIAGMIGVGTLGTVGYTVSRRRRSESGR